MNPVAEKNKEKPLAERPKPQRECIGCRKEVSLDQMEHFVRAETEEGPKLFFDPFHKLPGRGCHLHVTKGCITKAVRAGFRRSYKGSVPPLTEKEVVETLRLGITRRLLSTIRASFKSKDVYISEQAVSDAMKEDLVSLLFIANDAGAATQQKYERNAERKKVEISKIFDRTTLGQLIGNEGVSLIAFHGALAERLHGDLLKLAKLDYFETCRGD